MIFKTTDSWCSHHSNIRLILFLLQSLYQFYVRNKCQEESQVRLDVFQRAILAHVKRTMECPLKNTETSELIHTTLPPWHLSSLRVYFHPPNSTSCFNSFKSTFVKMPESKLPKTISDWKKMGNEPCEKLVNGNRHLGWSSRIETLLALRILWFRSEALDFKKKTDLGITENSDKISSTLKVQGFTARPKYA